MCDQLVLSLISLSFSHCSMLGSTTMRLDRGCEGDHNNSRRRGAGWWYVMLMLQPRDVGSGQVKGRLSRCKDGLEGHGIVEECQTLIAYRFTKTKSSLSCVHPLLSYNCFANSGLIGLNKLTLLHRYWQTSTHKSITAGTRK